MELDITALSHDGRGIARPSAPGGDAPGGPVVFVAGALPGERVSVRVTRRRKSFWEAEAEAVVRPAPDAVPPICPHRAACGGCPWQGMPYARQLEWKRRLILEALERIGGFDRQELEAMLGAVAPSPARTHFRNKMEFAFGGGAGVAMALGLRRRSGREVLPVPGCALLPRGAMDVVGMARAMAARSGLAPYSPPLRRSGGRQEARGFWRFFTLRRGLDARGRPRWWALCLTSPGTAAQREAVRGMGLALLDAVPDLAAFVHEERRSADALAAGERRVAVLGREGGGAEAACLRLPLGGRLFTLDAASFFQVNTGAAQVLARAAQALLPAAQDARRPAELADLYCGVGAPGQLLAPGYVRVWGLERDRRAANLARANAALAGLAHCRYASGDAAALPRLGERAANAWLDVLADPPRTGLAAQALEALLRARPQRILYISCNAATLARDAKILRNGCSLVALAAVDLFPHTPHVECLSVWQGR